MKYFSNKVFSEKKLFVYFKLKSVNELEEIHLLYEGRFISLCFSYILLTDFRREKS